MSDGALAREVRRLAVPAIAHSLLQTLVFVVDRIMLGHHGDASLAAMQLGGAIEWSIWSVFASFEVGTIARVGKHVGAGDPISARRAALLSFGMAGALGTVLALVSPLLLFFLPRLAPNMSAEAFDEARGYLGITMLASPVVFVAMTAVATLQGGGDTRTPLAIGIGANLVHVALNRVLILGFGFVPAMGARGAAISTAATFLLEAVFATLALTSTRRTVSLRKRAPNAHLGTNSGANSDAFVGATEQASSSLSTKEEARQLAHVAVPALAERILYHLGYVGFALIIARLGDASMAANQSLISVEAICFLSGDGFGIAAAALVAQKLGAKKPTEARRVTWLSARAAAITLTVFGLGAFLLRDRILPIFSTDPVVVALGRKAVPVLVCAQPFMATSIVLSQALRGAGRTREALAVTIGGAFFVRLAATWFFSITLGLGLVGIWLGSTADWIARASLLVGITTGRFASPRTLGAGPGSATVDR